MTETNSGTGSNGGARYDVAILGGGLAGLTLGLQLKQRRPGTSILIAEKREGPAPEAAFKVGESTVEISAHYFTNVIGMKDHIQQAQNPKAGLRFFFPADGNTDIARRVEWGSPGWPKVPAYQLDRGRFENALAERSQAAGIELVGGCRVQDVDLGTGTGDHRVTFSGKGSPGAVSARWVVDATGRAFVLKRKLGLEKDDGHHINSSWFRLAGGLNIEDWSQDEGWIARMSEPGLRGFSTNHLMGEGYWVWLIPLASGPISIGIVADPRFHPWERINTLDGAIDWLKEHEPQLGHDVERRRDQIEDFLKVEDFSYGCERVFSPERWCLTGEAGAFIDPLYSPGSDFIAFANTYITEAVCRDLDGEDVGARIEAYNAQYFRLFETTLADYKDQYHLFGNAQVTCVKVLWDYGYYWSFPTPWFFYDKWVDVEFVAGEADLFARAARLHLRMQRLFREWHQIGERGWRNSFVTLFPWLINSSDELDAKLDDDAVRAKAKRDLGVMEAFAVTVFEKAARLLPGVELDRKAPVNPYAVSLNPEQWAQDGLFDGSGISPREARQLVKGLQFAWLDEFGGS